MSRFEEEQSRVNILLMERIMANLFEKNRCDCDLFLVMFVVGWIASGIGVIFVILIMMFGELQW